MRTPVILKFWGADEVTKEVFGPPLGENPAARKEYPVLTPVVRMLSRMHAVAEVGVQAAGPPKLARSAAYPMLG